MFSQAFHQQQEVGRQVKAVGHRVQRLQGKAGRLSAVAERLEAAALTFGDLENYVQVKWTLLVSFCQTVFFRGKRQVTLWRDPG